LIIGTNFFYIKKKNAWFDLNPKKNHNVQLVQIMDSVCLQEYSYHYLIISYMLENNINKLKH